MKLKSIASTFCLSALLIGGMTTEAAALTLPEPSTHSYSFNAWAMTPDGTSVDDAIEATVTFNGYYGTISTEDLGYQHQFVDAEDVHVIAEGSTVVLTLKSDYDGLVEHGLFSPGFDTSTLWDPENGTGGVLAHYGNNAQGATIFSTDRDFGTKADVYVAYWYLKEEGSDVVESRVSGYPYTPTLYSLEETGKNEFTYSPNLGHASLFFQSFNTIYDDANYFEINPGHVLVIDQEGIDELVETGYTFFTGQTEEQMAGTASMVGPVQYHYPNLLELFAETPTTPESTPSDLDGYTFNTSWATSNVQFAYDNDLLVDSLGKDFTVSITREQIADLLVNMIEKASGQTLPMAEVNPFTDTSSETALKANAAGIINGKEGGLFDPDNTAKREEICIMLYRAIEKLEELTGESYIDFSLTAFDGYPDIAEISSWATYYVAIIVNNGVMSGSNGSILPKSETTIEQCLVLSNNLFKFAN
ncbi:MAG: S-layer homology domain-containing protein [Eubacteriales bacterium]